MPKRNPAFHPEPRDAYLPNPIPGRHIPPLLWVMLLSCSLAGATSIRRLDFDQLNEESELIVHGRVVSSSSYVLPARGWILTDTRIQVVDALKGNAARFVTVTELGGVVGDTGMLVPGTASFRVGEEAVVFLKNVEGRWRTSGLIQGKFPIVEAQGEKIVLPAVPVDHATGRIRLESLKQRIRRMQPGRQER
ncbi:MAG: hypothetical protein HYX74_09580 [Acidobacteria bacterium]|nr:hypothetical protein [Acidobacteriota bacterium]